MAHLTTSPSQAGTSAIEHTLSILLLCLIALGLLESTHWLILRQALNHALLDTARIAVTQQAHPTIIREAFIAQLARLPAFQFKAEHGYWSIEHRTLAPSQNPVQHSYQSLQYQQGNVAIFDQNTLVLRLQYGHQPLTPLLRTLIKYSSAWQDPSFATLTQHGLVPIVTEVQLAMQSDQDVIQRHVLTSPPNKALQPHTQPPAPPLHSLLWAATPLALPVGESRPSLPLHEPSEDSCDGDYCCGPLL